MIPAWPFMVAVALGGVLAAQGGKADLRLDYERMQRERDEQAVREGKLIHLLIRHGLGLPVDASEYTKLSKTEQGISAAVAQTQLRQVQAELQKRAAELKRHTYMRTPGKSTVTSTPAAPHGATANTKPGTAGKPGSGHPATAQAVNGNTASRDVATGGTRTADPNAVHPGKGWPRSPQPAPTSRPQQPVTASAKVQAIIKGSSNRGAVGRILFKAGQYQKALEELAPVEQDKSANYSDLFYLARCHEELHDIAREDSKAAQAEAAQATKNVASAEAEMKRLEKAGMDTRSAGGTNESVAEYTRLSSLLRAASATAKVQTQRYQKKRRVAASHYEKAYSLFILIEGRDVERTEDGTEVAGYWAEAARSARNMMKWIETKKEWTPPKIDWDVK